MEDYDISAEEIYEMQKKRDSWTLNEGLALLIDLKYFGDPLSENFGYEPFLNLDLTVLKILKRAVKTKTLKTFGSYSDENKEFLTIEVLPFEFLEFVKEKDLYPIPPELDYKKNRLESGDIQYIWLSQRKRQESERLSDPDKTKSIDYSFKTRSEQSELAKRWREEGKTRREIAKLLYPKEFENGNTKPASLMKRVDRL